MHCLLLLMLVVLIPVRQVVSLIMPPLPPLPIDETKESLFTFNLDGTPDENFLLSQSDDEASGQEPVFNMDDVGITSTVDPTTEDVTTTAVETTTTTTTTSTSPTAQTTTSPDRPILNIAPRRLLRRKRPRKLHHVTLAGSHQAMLNGSTTIMPMRRQRKRLRPLRKHKIHLVPQPKQVESEVNPTPLVLEEKLTPEDIENIKSETEVRKLIVQQIRNGLHRRQGRTRSSRRWRNNRKQLRKSKKGKLHRGRINKKFLKNIKRRKHGKEVKVLVEGTKTMGDGLFKRRRVKKASTSFSSIGTTETIMIRQQ